MEIAVLISAAFAIIAAALVFFIVRRLVRWAFRLALIVALAVAVLVGAVVLWWYGYMAEPERPARRPAATRTNAR